MNVNGSRTTGRQPEPAIIRFGFVVLAERTPCSLKLGIAPSPDNASLSGLPLLGPGDRRVLELAIGAGQRHPFS